MLTERLATVIFILTTLGVAIGIIAAIWRSSGTREAGKRQGAIAAILLIAWLGSTATLAANGAFSDFSGFPPRIMPVLFAGNIAMIVVASSALGRRLALYTPLSWLVGIHTFRIGVEVTLALLFHAGVVPVQMTIEGRNWDILVGLSAIPIAWLAAQNRLPNRWLLIWTLASITLLLNIVMISILSLPTAFRAFPAEPANTIIATAPYIWLPALLVPVAFGAHLIVLRRLLLNRAGQATPIALVN